MSKQLRMQARGMAERYGVDPIIFEKMIEQESNFNPNAKNKKSGAVGLGQITKPTGIQPGYGVKPIEDRYDPIENLRFSAQYLKAMVDEFGGYPLGLAAYNAGPGVIKGAGNKIPNYPETQRYVRNIMVGYQGGQVDPRLAEASKLGLESTDGTSAPLSRPSNLGSGGGGIDATTQKQINRMIEDLFGGSKRPMPRPPALMGIKAKGDTSPLSKMGIPGIGNIAKYSAPGGVASLYNQGKKQTKI